MTENICGWIAISQRAQRFPSLKQHEQADFLVIGGGISGLSAAHRLAVLHPQRRIIVLDRQTIGQGASSRNSGFVVCHEKPEWSECVGNPRHAAYRRRAKIASEAAQLVKTNIATMGIDCDLSDAGYYFAVHDVEKLSHAEAKMQTLQSVGASVKEYRGEELASKLGTPFYQAAIHCYGGNALLNPAKYITGLLQALPENVTVFENTDITQLDSTSKGGYRASSVNFSISSPSVIVCTGPFLPRLGIKHSQTFPVELSASLTRILNPAELAQMQHPQPWGVLSGALSGATIRLTNDHRILIRNTLEYRQQDFTPAALAQRQQRHLRGLQRRFTFLNQQDIAYTWSGHLSATRSGEPFFQQISPQLFAASGCNGSGVARASLWGKLLAEYASGNVSELLQQVQAQATPGWLPPRPFFDIAASLRLHYESLKAGTEK